MVSLTGVQTSEGSTGPLDMLLGVNEGRNTNLSTGLYYDLPSYRRNGFIGGLGKFLSTVGKFLSELDTSESIGQDRLAFEQTTPLDKFSQWYNSRGVDVEVYVNTDVLNHLVKDLSENSRYQEVGAILAGYDLNPNKVIITDYELVIPEVRSSTYMEDVGNVYLNSMRNLRNRRTFADMQYGGYCGNKVFVGGAHAHPKHGPFLSSIDIGGLRDIMNHARKCPGAYASTGGNLELVFSPKSDSYAFFKIMSDGRSERIPVNNITTVSIN